MVYAMGKFQPYLVSLNVIVYTEYATLKYLMNKKYAKPRLICWILLLQEFCMEIKDKKGVENVVANRLLRLVLDGDCTNDLPIDDSFPDDDILRLARIDVPWFADIDNYLASGTTSHGYSSQRKKNIFL